jgi:hypothetical protein
MLPGLELLADVAEQQRATEAVDAWLTDELLRMDVDDVDSIARWMHLLVMAGYGGPLLKGIVLAWSSYPHSTHFRVFDATVVCGLKHGWDSLPSRLDAPLYADPDGCQRPPWT